MKKRAALWIPWTLLTLFSCQGQSAFESLRGDRILAYKDENLDSYIEIQSSEELDAICRYEDALVIVTQESCQACATLYPYLRDFVSEYHYLLYTVDYQIYRVNYSATANKEGTYAFLYPELNKTPTFLYFRDGECQDAENPRSLTDGLEEELLSRFLDLDLYRINDLVPTGRESYQMVMDEESGYWGLTTNALESLLANRKDETVNVLFTWRRCQDCLEYKEKVLYPFLSDADNTHGKLYVYELDGYYLLKNSTEEEESQRGLSSFSRFCQEFHLADYPVIDRLGNVAGVAPTLVTYRKEDYSLSVFRNDFDPYVGEDGKVRYRQSFYPEVLSLSSDTAVESELSRDFSKAVEELRDKAAEIEIEKALSYLEENL